MTKYARRVLNLPTWYERIIIWTRQRVRREIVRPHQQDVLERLRVLMVDTRPPRPRFGGRT